MDDKRTLKTKQLIKITFLDLLKKKPINKITISSIARIANIGRGTFYFHYLDVYDLQEKMEDDICLGLEKIFEEHFKSPADFKQLFLAIIDYIVSINEQFSSLITEQSSDNRLMRKVRKLYITKMCELMPNKSVSTYHKIKFPFVVSGVIGVIDDWVKGETELQKDALALEISNIIGMIE